MSEKQRRAKRRAAAKRCREERKGLSPLQRMVMQRLNRTYRRRLRPWLPLTPQLIVVDEVGSLPSEDEMARASAVLAKRPNSWAGRRHG